MISFRSTCVLAVTLGFAVLSVQAAAPDVIKERRQGLKDMGEAFKTVRDELSGGKDAAKIKAASATITKTANAMVNWFPAGSGTEAGVKTLAKPEIWSDPATFTAARQKLVDEAAKFALLANSGDMAAIGGGVRGLGGSCKNCHDNFRVKED